MGQSLFDLSGKTAVVAGGTSGIGRTLALGLGWLWRKRPKLARQVATAGSIVVIAGGGYWFLQRTVFAT